MIEWLTGENAPNTCTYPMEEITGNSEGGVGLKSPKCKGKCEAKLEFQERWGSKNIKR